jgi:SP family myo-inositol transporter-like MFS transporter 13
MPFPEGLSVDEAFTLFDEGFGVKKSKEMRREKIRLQQTYNTEGLHVAVTEAVDKSEASHKDNVDSI